jgi:putative transposase
MLRALASAPTQAQAEQQRREFEAWCHQHGDTKAAETLRRDGEQRLTFSHDPRAHGVHLRTTTIVESPLAALRLRTAAATRVKRVERATAVIWKMLMVAQKKFRRLNAPERLAKVYAGGEDKDGIAVTREGVAA